MTSVEEDVRRKAGDGHKEGRRVEDEDNGRLVVEAASQLGQLVLTPLLHLLKEGVLPGVEFKYL